MTACGIVSRVTPVHTAVRNCTRDEGRSFEVGNQVLISSHRKLLLSKAMVVNVAEKKVGTRFRQARLREASASEPLQKCRKPIRRCQNRGVTLVWGLSRSFDRVAHLFFFVSFFVRSESPFLRPDPALRLRRRAQELSRLAVAPTLRHCSAFARPHLDSFEHDGTLGAIGMTIRGEPAFGRDQSRHNLVFGGCKNPTMMQPCASAAKLRDGGPILPLGITAMAQAGTRHLEPSSATRHKRTDWAETVGCLQQPPFIASGAG